MRETLAETLEALGACGDGIEWAKWNGEQYERAWRECDQGDWLLWLAARVTTKRRAIVCAALECARLVLPVIPSGDKRQLAAIEAVEGWLADRITLQDVYHAGDMIFYDEPYGAARYESTSMAARYLAWGVRDVFLIDAVVRYVVEACGPSAANQCADIIRKHIAFEDVLAGLEEIGWTPRWKR